MARLEIESVVSESDKSVRSAGRIGALEEQRFIRRVDWNLFRQFYEIAQSGSVSAAARRLNMHQPSLSAALKRLEDHLGVILCRRTSQGIELTPAGKVLMELSADMIETIRLAPKLTSQAANQIEGTLTIRMISSVICPEFDEALASLNRRHPNIELRIEVSPWRMVIDALSSGECDVGVTYDSGPRPYLQYYPLFRETQQIYCGRSHPLFGRRVNEPAILAQERFILTHGDEPEDLERFRQRYGLGRSASGHAEDLQEVLRLIKLGIGIGFLPTIVAERTGPDELWPILIEPLLPAYFIYLVTPPPSRLSTPTRLLHEEIRRRLQAKGDLW